MRHTVTDVQEYRRCRVLSELSTLARLSGLFYEAAFSPERTGAAMAHLSRVLGDAWGVFGLSGRRRTETFHGDCSADFEALFFDPRIANPLLPVLADPGLNGVLSDADLMPNTEFRRTVFYNEWLTPQHAAGFLLAKAPIGGGLSAVLAMNLCRSPGGKQAGATSDRTAAALLKGLAPVIGRVAAIRLRTAGTALRHVGWGIVDGVGRTIGFDAMAEALLAAPGAGIELVHGQIRLRTVSGETNLDRLLAAACRRGPDNPATGGEMLVRPAAPGGPLLLVGIDPLVGENEPLGTSGLALLRVENLSPHAEADDEVEERLHQLLGLTAREAHLALSLAAGRSLAEHAVGRGVSLETARTHLRGLFAKTDTSRQGELVALLNRITRGPR